ncbi:hypothetical protein MB84_28015 (plasmid) [Pandoraea oxalativorans]|uniref:Uncharacterized protein n=1 Tax=Pandoraea oxalativorans TaxID=573737 RepID=A0A0G3IBU6_9BURK|nr:hypothetical protein MB84_28015 [Pandoraea oxalativorans]
MHTPREAPTESNRPTPASALPRYSFVAVTLTLRIRLKYGPARADALNGALTLTSGMSDLPQAGVFYAVFGTCTALWGPLPHLDKSDQSTLSERGY